MVKSKTAAELMADLQADPVYQKKQLEREARRSAQKAESQAEQVSLLADLQAIGWSVQSVWDLVNTSTPYPEAIAILLEHLQRHYSDRTREGIARALATPDAAIAWQTLSSEYRKAPDGSGVKSGLAAALAAAANDQVIGELANLARDPRNGSSRLLLLNGLRKSKSITALETIKDLEKDPVFSEEIASWKKGK